MHLYLIRHGESHVNLKDWDGGHVDASLTDLGQRQAAVLGQWLPTAIPRIDILYTSTMARARETAGFVSKAYDIDPSFDDRLREYGNNRLDHTPWPNDNLPHTFAEYAPMARPFAPITTMEDRDESWMHFRTRVGHFVEEAVELHTDQIVMVVCHGGVIQAVFDHVFNVGPWRRCEVWNMNTSVSHLRYINHPGREVWRLYYQNRIEHLRDIA
jgi:broad specificity phosphatase PhoE